jgi:hypothetical protein
VFHVIDPGQRDSAAILSLEVGQVPQKRSEIRSGPYRVEFVFALHLIDS